MNDKNEEIIRRNKGKKEIPLTEPTEVANA